MQSKKDTNYAVILNNKVSQIFNGNDIKQWDERSINAIEIPKNLTVAIGDKYDSVLQAFVEKTLDEEKEDLLNKINFSFERELSFLQGNITRGEIDTWTSQLREAKIILAKQKEETPMLTKIAKERGIDIETLATKIVEKNNKYLERVGQLLGYRQSLEKQIEAAKTLNALKKIVYKSPFYSEAKE